MISETDITKQLRDLLDREVDASYDRDCLRVLTPFEYPDGDGIVVRIEQASDGRYRVSDGGGADATLIGRVGKKSSTAPAVMIAQRYGALFEGRQLVTMVEKENELAGACQRIALAAAGLAEGATWLKQRPSKEVEFVDVIASELRQRAVKVEEKRTLEGASGHTHTASLFVPNTETVIEPVGGERAWNAARAVYVEFGDLRQMNGYRLMAVLDDREHAPSPEIESLLSQVAEVASWQAHDAWLAEISGC